MVLLFTKAAPKIHDLIFWIRLFIGIASLKGIFIAAYKAMYMPSSLLTSGQEQDMRLHFRSACKKKHLEGNCLY